MAIGFKAATRLGAAGRILLIQIKQTAPWEGTVQSVAAERLGARQGEKI
ncbi:hypothetical protein [Tardiphaga sp. P5_C10]